MPVILDGRFQLGEVIDRSPGSELYQALDLETKEMVAVKVIRPTTRDSNERLSRQLQEFRLLRNMGHPNSVQVIGTGLTSDNLFFVAMEYLHGQTLREILRERGVLSPEEVAFYLDQLAGVLDFIHKNNIVHRNIKPENIMICPTGDGEEMLKLMGFVFAKILTADNNPNMNNTQAGVAIGTPAYMSTEQALGKRVTRLSDIYAVGVILYESLTGHLPFEEKNDLQTMLAHVKKEVPRFAEKDASLDIPENVEAVVRKALSKMAGERQPTVGELAARFREAVQNPGPADIKSVTSSQTSLGLPTAPAQAAPKETSSFPTVVALAVGIILIGIAVGLLWGVMMR